MSQRETAGKVSGGCDGGLEKERKRVRKESDFEVCVVFFWCAVPNNDNRRQKKQKQAHQHTLSADHDL